LEHGDVVSYATPRRLAVWVKKLAARQPEQDLKRRGPPVNASFDAAGAPTRAALAFAESCGTTVDALQKARRRQGDLPILIGKKAGAVVTDLLPGIVKAALDALPIPRAHALGLERRRVCAAGSLVAHVVWKDVVPVTLLDTVSGDLTRGHRFSRAETYPHYCACQLRGRVE